MPPSPWMIKARCRPLVKPWRMRRSSRRRPTKPFSITETVLQSTGLSSRTSSVSGRTWATLTQAGSLRNNTGVAKSTRSPSSSPLAICKPCPEPSRRARRASVRATSSGLLLASPV